MRSSRIATLLPPLRARLRARPIAFMAMALAALLAGGCGDDGPQGPPVDNGTCGHIDSAGGVDLESSGAMVFHQFGFQTSGALTIPVGGVLRDVHVHFLDADGNPIEIANDCDIMRLEVEFLDPSIAEMQRQPGLLWTVDFAGKAVGTTTLRVELWHSAHRHFRSEPIQVTVTPAP